MKPVVIFLVAAGVFGIGMVIQLGVMPQRTNPVVAKSEAPAKAIAKPKALFPDDLAPAAQAKVVDIAAEYKPGANSYKIAFLTPNGKLHRWHNDIPEDWQAGSVEETELVVVLPSKQDRTFVNRIDYRNAPSIDRYIHHTEIAIVEPKTGNLIENRKFRHLPRQVHNIEAFRTTMIGRSIEWFVVFDYVAKHSKTGFAERGSAISVDKVVD
jgi:hypothetical protein